MMKTTQNKSSGVIQRTLSAVMGLALLAVVLPGMALANSGAGAVLLNVATVNYDDATGTNSYSATSSASVTVNLLAAAPTIVTSAATPSTSVQSGTGATYSYTITSNANGSDVYDLAGNITAEVNLAAGTTAGPSLATVTLGASVIIGHPALNQIQISAGSGTNLADTDIVVINGIDYEISGAPTAGTLPSHDNNTVATTDVGTTTTEVPIVITLVAGPVSATAPDFVTTPEIGTQVGERTTFTVLVTGTNSGAVNGTATISPTGTSQDDGTKVGTADAPRTTTYLGNFVSILKEVRNVTTGGGFAATATGKPGEVLEYQVVMTNTSAANATVVTLDDPVPAYTTYVNSSTLLNTKTVAGDGAASPVAAGLVVDDDNPARVAGVAATGIIGPGNSATVIYQVTITP